jgi:hypothetical protein
LTQDPGADHQSSVTTVVWSLVGCKFDWFIQISCIYTSNQFSKIVPSFKIYSKSYKTQKNIN